MDGKENTIQEVNVKATDIPHNPYRSAFHKEITTFYTEKEAQRNTSPSESRYWKV